MVIKSKEFSKYSLICWSGLVITLALTPWMNSDSLIIPKVIILFCLSLYLLPNLLNFRKFFKTNWIVKLLIFISILYILQLILVVIKSDAPFEQQFYGRTGRGLGFITEISLVILLLVTSMFANSKNLKVFLFTLTLACTITSAYSILQKFGLDIFQWVTRTNGIIGTLGNPNFQSSFAAMCLVPSIVFLFNRKYVSYGLISTASLTILIFLSQSTQGYILAIASVLFLLIIWTYFKNKILSVSFIVLSLIFGFFVFIGMLNLGPLNQYLYKGSVQSRMDFYETTFKIANQNPLFGVGIDSLGDYYLMNRSERVARGINEFTDSAHNYFLNYASTGGYPLALLYVLLNLIVLYNFIALFRQCKSFDPILTSLFCVWASFQLQSLISPSNIPLIVWNAIVSGTVIGLANNRYKEIDFRDPIINYGLNLIKPFSSFLLLVGLIITYPYFNVDRLQMQANKKGDALLALKAAKSFPESVVRYSRLGQALLDSKLPDQALDLARSAVAFNPNAPSAWALLLLNEKATYEERTKAREEVLRLDPFNDQVRAFIVPNKS